VTGENDDGDFHIYRRNADHSGQVQVTSGPVIDVLAAWGPGDSYLVFARRDALAPSVPSEIYSVAPDGTNLTQLTDHSAASTQPAPGPTGQIAFASDRAGNFDIYLMDPDGSNVRRLTEDPASDAQPNWSPDGTRIAFESTRDGNEEIYVMDADGSNESRLTTTPSNREFSPAWSPDGTQIAFADETGESIDKVDADGSERQTLISYPGIASLDWQPLPVSTPSAYARPKSANRVQVSLVPAFNACTAPNREHGPPLAFGSCAPPAPGSSHLTAGVGDGHPAPARSSGFVRLKVRRGVPGGEDDTTARLRVSLTNVMRTSDLSEYTGELRASVGVRITDSEGAVSQTLQDLPLELTVPCLLTPEAGMASVCDLGTDVDAVLPGATPEGTRAIWQVDQVKVYDGGPDEDADTESDNELFAVQGVFVP